MVLEDDSVNLCAITLTWMFTSSNRHLRDRATKALTNLLSGHLSIASELLKRFEKIDDPYIAERLYAAVYGIAMRSNDKTNIGLLASTVYSQIFADSSPPAHILLRDYARGIIERASIIGASIDVPRESINPPYKSVWPHIPDDEEIKPFLPDWSRGAHDSGDLEWARNSIGSSVMSGDFAHYVIGTYHSSNWLSLRLDEAPWRPVSERLTELVEKFSGTDREAWERFNAADNYLKKLITQKWFLALQEAGKEKSGSKAEKVSSKHEFKDAAMELAKTERAVALDELITTISEPRSRTLEYLLEKSESREKVDRLDLKIIQRYVLRRVFDLGWTTELFGEFDRFSVGNHGRDAAKAERIGKKYQWIAYHEMLALIADHFQYRELYREDGDKVYMGPWQMRLRDIDPSCLLKSIPGGTSLSGHQPAWWAPMEYRDWPEDQSWHDWTMTIEDLPQIENLLHVTEPTSGIQWLNVQSHLEWSQPTPADQEEFDVDRGELWYASTGYLIYKKDVAQFMEWAEGMDFWGLWLPKPPEAHEMFLGEHAWSSVSEYFQKPYFGDDGWTQPAYECPAKIKCATIQYSQGSSSFDCSTDESFSLQLPTIDLIAGLRVRWSGTGADYINSSGQLIAFDPTVHSNGPSTFLIRYDVLKEYLDREHLTICWAVTGEKRILGSGLSSSPHSTLRLSGAYQLQEGRLTGFLKCIFEDRENDKPSSALLQTIRTQTSTS